MAPPPELDLRSVDAKLKWAVAHYEAVDAEINAWIERSNYSVIAKRNPEFTQFWFEASLPGQLPNFERWSLMLGDCFTNLRDTLDHAVFAIAHLPTSPLPDKAPKACFLSVKSPDEFQRQSKTKLASVPDAVRDVVFRYQSFNRPHQVLPPLIHLLGELANGNKHRLLNVVMAIPGLSKVQMKAIDGRNDEVKVYPGIEVFDGAVLLRIDFPYPEPTMELESIDSRLHIAIKHSPRDRDISWSADRTPYNVLFPILLGEVAAILDELRNAC